MAPAIGIDLGTKYSCVAVFQRGKVEIIANEQANRKTPSYVAFTDTERLVGDPAKKQAAKNPVNTIFDVKRLIGGRVYDEKTREDIKHLPFQVGRKRGRPMLKVEFKGVEKTFAPEEISSMVLMKMKETAEAFLGTKVKEAVITVPAYFNDSQRQATKDAGTIAGLNVLRIINEPTAAALAYGLQKKLKEERNVLIYGLGGGTFDVTVLTITEGSVFKVKATSGDTHLGGEDFDRRIMKFLAQKFCEVNHKDIQGDPRAMGFLRNAAEEAKCDLSMNTVSYIQIYALFEGVDFTTKLTRSWFNDLCLDLFKRTIEHVKKALSDAKLDKDNIYEIVLVGGSTRIPKVQELLREFFAGKKLNLSINPDEAVVCGAAIQAALMSGDSSSAIQDFKLFDVAPLSLGLDISRNRNMHKLIAKNTEVPHKKKMHVNLVANAQNKWFFGLFEGENALCDDNHFLGVFDVYGVPSVPACNAEIEITFDLDVNGILKVSVEGCTKGAAYDIIIQGEKINWMNTDVISEMRDAAERYASETKLELTRLNAQNSFQSHVYKLQTALSINGNKKNNENGRKKANFRCKEALEWLDANQDATVEEYEGKNMTLVSQTEGVFG